MSAALGRRYYGWQLVWVLGITTIIAYGTTQYLFGVLVVPLEREFGWSRAELAGAYSLAVLLAGIFGVPIGALTDRYGARITMSLGALLGGLSLLGLSRVESVWQLYLVWSLGIGLASSLTYYPISYIVIANWFDARRADAMATLTLFGAFASPLFLPLSGTLVAALGWRAAVLILGCVLLVIAVPICALLLRRHPEDHGLHPDGAEYASPAGGAESGMSARDALRTRTFWLITSACCLFTFSGTVVFVHLVAYIISKQYSPVFAATLAGSAGLAYLPGRFLAKRLSRKVDAHVQLSASLVLQAIGMIILLAERSVAWLIVWLIVYGAAFGTFAPLRGTLMAEHFGRRAYGAIVANQGMPMALCAAAGPLLAGRLYDVFGNYVAAFLICALALVLAAVCIALTTRAETGLRSSASS